MTEKKSRLLEYFWMGWLVLVGCVVPLAFIQVKAGQWEEGFIGVTAINENLKFVALLWCSIPGLALWGWLKWTGGSMRPIPKGVLGPLSLLLFACVFSTTFSIDPQRGWLTALELFIMPAGLMIVTASVDWRYSMLSRLFLGWFPAAVIVSVIGVTQFYEWSFQKGSLFYDWNQFAQSLPRYGLGSIFYSPNLAGEYLVLIVPLALVMGYQVWKKERITACFLAAGILLIQGFVILSRARGAWVGLVVGVLLVFALFVWVVKKSKNLPNRDQILKRIYRGCGVVLLGFFILLITSPKWAVGEGDDLPGPTDPLQANRFIEEFKSILKADDNGRIGIWKDTLTMIQHEAGFFGVGAGQFRIHYPKYYNHSIGLFEESVAGPHGVFKQTRRVHNDYLQIWAEFGLIGIACWVLLAWRIIRGAGRSIHHYLAESDWDGLLYVLALLSGVLIFFVMMALDFPSRMPTTVALGWIMMGLLLSLEPKKELPASVPEVFRPLLLAGNIVLIYACGKTGWHVFKGDLYRIQANQAYSRNDMEKGFRYSQIAVKYLPWDEDAWFLLYQTSLRTKGPLSGLKFAQEHLERNPWYHPSMMNELDALHRLGRYEESRATARRILETFPDHPKADWFREYLGE